MARTLGCQQEFEAEIESEIRGEGEPNSGRRCRGPHERLVDVHRIDALLDSPLPLDDAGNDDVIIVASSDNGESFLLPICAEGDAIALTVVRRDNRGVVEIIGWIDVAEGRRIAL
ncbi:MAG TPA: hypothetical protein VMS64_19210 [Candidatus Methylomirabilis sp.]|nr:hypothetical protein [Candidatus Methylomirabilis sp.]